MMKKILFLSALLLLASCSHPSPSAVVENTPEVSPSPEPTHTVVPTPTATTVPDIPEPERPLLMAHYMPWYQAPSVSGYWGWHWTMEHFQPGRQDENGRREIASYVMPLTGPYDSSDDAVLEYQILLMKLSGIDGVIVDWYGIENFWDYGILNESTNKLFTYVEKAGLHFAICYEDQTIKHMVNNDHLDTKDVYTHGQDVMLYLQDTWFNQKPYLKVTGQPVLFTFGPQYFTNVSDWEKLFSVLEIHPAFVTLDKHTEAAGIASFPWPPMWASTGGVLSQKRLETYLTGFYQKAESWDYVVAGAFPGFKDIYEEAGVASETRYLDPREGETLKYTLQLAIEQKPDVIQLITWNDYGETTSIEPTEEFGYQYLEMVQDARRAVDASFTYTAEDLRLPLRLYKLRDQNRQDAGLKEPLNQVFEALRGGDLDKATSLLAGLENP